jgi:hypothetical protein
VRSGCNINTKYLRGFGKNSIVNCRGTSDGLRPGGALFVVLRRKLFLSGSCVGGRLDKVKPPGLAASWRGSSTNRLNRAVNTLDIHLQVPDLWQQEALRGLREARDVVVHAPTGAGKTYIFELLVEAGLNKQAVFTVPTRALANDKLHEWRARGWDVGIATGDLADNLDAKVVVATLETQKSKFLKRLGPALFVVDEYQMLGDRTRGVSYELAPALLPPTTQLLLMSGSVANPEHVVEWLRRIGRNACLVSHEERPVPQEEVFLDSLPERVPAGITGFWPRLVARALMADLGPILVFAPQRKAAEQLARQFAAAFPIEDPLALTPEQRRLAGNRLGKMLSRRVAYHHSGLGYRQRAGLIEPLAKAGQLRIVVATTGLAAGINFSMRSVLVSEREYRMNNLYEEVRPDELLQMFGRAGRRGLDEIGYVLVAPGRPRLSDGRPLYLQRSRRVDWPSLIGIMQGAAEQGRMPFAEAVNACERLFSTQQVPLGVEHSLSTGPKPCGLWVDAERARFARPHVVEMLNARGRWEEKPAEPVRRPWGEARLRHKEHWRHALEFPASLEGVGEGNLCRLPGEGRRRRYGRELPVATRDPRDPSRVQVAKTIRRKLRETKAIEIDRFLSDEAFHSQVVPLLGSIGGDGEVFDLVERNGALSVRLDFSSRLVEGWLDSTGAFLLDPPERKEYPDACRGCDQLAVCEGELERKTSPALAWRKLGLVDKEGAPTRRGTIFSFFFQGEGLAIAAALEDPGYPVDELVYDIANLRAGHRFSEEEAARGSRLGSVCRETYARADYTGYLEGGVPPAYGDGAAEVLREVSFSRGRRAGAHRRHPAGGRYRARLSRMAQPPAPDRLRPRLRVGSLEGIAPGSHEPAREQRPGPPACRFSPADAVAKAAVQPRVAAGALTKQRWPFCGLAALSRRVLSRNDAREAPP